MKRPHLSVKRQYVVNLAKILVAGGLLFWLVHSGRLDFSVLLSAPANAYHLLGLGALLANMLLQYMRWWRLLRTQQVNMSIGRALQLSWIAEFFSVILPGAAGGELVRGYYVVRDAPGSKVAGVSTLLVDRALGLYALLWLGTVSLPFLGGGWRHLPPAILQMEILVLVLLVGTSGLLLGLWFRPICNLALHLVPRRFRPPIEETLNAYHVRGRDLLICFGLSLLANLMLMVGFLAAARVLGSPCLWQQVFFVGPLAIIANTLPISPGGVGAAETTASLLFAQFGVTTGAMIALTARAWQVLLRLPGGLMYVVLRSSSAPSASEGDVLAAPAIRQDQVLTETGPDQ
jgi:uncharacterized membrane protein YbhN (UPF0104 family)